MREFLLSLIFWMVLPTVLVAVNVLTGGNVLFLVLLLTWLGFGVFFVSVSEDQA